MGSRKQRARQDLRAQPFIDLLMQRGGQPSIDAQEQRREGSFLVWSWSPHLALSTIPEARHLVDRAMKRDPAMTRRELMVSGAATISVVAGCVASNGRESELRSDQMSQVNVQSIPKLAELGNVVPPGYSYYE